jgi:tetratricopeptide (TPR) repeat protein
MVKSKERIRLNKLQREAEGYLELGVPALALKSLERLGDPAQFAASTLYLWGEALRGAERYPEAISPLERAAEAEPENVHVWLALGWCYKRTGQLERAIEAIHSALKADPAEALLHYNLACYLSLAGNKEQALDHLSRALNLDPDYRNLIDAESDFDPLRSDPDFQTLLGIIV